MFQQRKSGHVSTNPGVPGSEKPSKLGTGNGRNLGSLTSWGSTLTTLVNCRIVEPSKDTTDGRNPAPVDMVNISLFTYKVLYIPGGCFGFLPSTGINKYSTKLQTFLVQLWSYVRELLLIDMGRIFKVKSFVIRHPEPTGNVGCDVIGRCCKLFTHIKQTEHNILEGDPHVRSSLLWLFLQHSYGKWH